MAEKKKWNEAESAMWQNTHENFEKMPPAMKIQFCEAIAAFLEDVPETDKLSRKIVAAMASLQSAWKNFPEPWGRDDLQKVCAKSRRIWEMIESYDNIKAEYETEILRSQARDLFEQIPFDQIEIEGRTFSFKASNEAEPPQLPDDNIPF